jgi:hypothetical protein
MYIICLLVILFIITLLFMYKLFSASNSINEDSNILLNKINDLENDNKNNLDLFNNYASYRLGDGFYLTNNHKAWLNNPHHIVDKYFIPLKELSETYNNSILSEYLQLSNYTERNWDILIEIVNNKFITDINVDRSTDCLLHVRVGDVIDELCSGKNFLNKFYNNINKNQEKDKSKIIRCNYIKSLKYFQEKFKKLVKMGITKVYLMAGAHIKLPSYKYSTYYINKILEELQEVGIDVELKLGGSPDDDLLFSMNFDYFIPSEGQYCRLIKELNEKINPDFTIL